MPLIFLFLQVFQMQRHVNHLQICRFLGFQDSSHLDKMKLAVSFWRYYLHGNKFNSGTASSNPGYLIFSILFYSIFQCFEKFDLSYFSARFHYFQSCVFFKKRQYFGRVGGSSPRSQQNLFWPSRFLPIAGLALIFIDANNICRFNCNWTVPQSITFF